MYQQIINPKEEEEYLDPKMVKAVYAAHGRRSGYKLLEQYGKEHFRKMGRIGGKRKAEAMRNKPKPKIPPV